MGGYLIIAIASVLILSLFIFFIYLFFFKKSKTTLQKSETDLLYEKLQLKKILKLSALFALVSLSAVIIAQLTDILSLYFIAGIHIWVLVLGMYFNNIYNNTKFLAAAFLLTIFNVLIQSTELIFFLQIHTNGDILKIILYVFQFLRESLQALYIMQFLYPLPFIFILIAFIKNTDSSERMKVLKIILAISVLEPIISQGVYSLIFSYTEDFLIQSLYNWLTLFIDYVVFLYFIVSSLKELDKEAPKV